MNQKLTYEYIRHGFNEYGYELISTTYINSSSKLKYRCPNNHIGMISWNNFQRGRRCPFCINNNIKHDINFIRSEFEKEGYKLLSTNYLNNKQRLEFICNNNHISDINWMHWQRGQRCTYCGGNSHVSIDTIFKDFNKYGYRLLSKKYIDSQYKLKYICPYGHKHSISWNNWQQGQRCSTCSFINRSGSNHWNWKGGVSCEPYCDAWSDKEYKDSIKERDNYECQNPDCWKTGNRIIIHHVDYDKQNCKPNNLITVCNSCNSRANFNRDYWKEVYNNLMVSKCNNYGVINEACS